MLRNYLKLALRNIRKDKAYAAINISGLAVGLASSIFILLWVRNELSYDRFHVNAERIYRVASDFGDAKTAANSAGMPAGLKAALPVVTNTVRLGQSETGTVLLESAGAKFEESNAFFADPAFLQIFSYPLLEGNAKTALDKPDAIVLTHAMARKYFGSADPIGKILRKDDSENVVVTAVLGDIPANSDLQFDFILPMASLARTRADLKNNVWNNFNFYDYILLDEQFVPTRPNLVALEKQIGDIFHKHSPDTKASFHLQPLTQIHLEPERVSDMPGHGNAQYVRIFFIVAVLILGVACINFMNLATARSARRAKEIGLRKVSGAIRGQLIIQFLSESIFISFVALAIAVVLVALLLPAFNQIADRKLSLRLSDFSLWLSLCGIALLTGLISGSYPALFLSGFNPVKVLKGNVRSMGGNVVFRNALVITQFTAAIVLLVGTVVIYRQLNFIKDRDPGFAKENLLYMPLSGDLFKQQEALQTELRLNPLTSEFSLISDLPINLGSWTLSVHWDGKDPHTQPSIPVIAVDENFVQAFRMSMIAGRSFSSSFKTDSGNYMINEKMMHLMGLNAGNVIGKPLDLWGNPGTVVGVVKDFNYKPIQQTIEPMVMPFKIMPGRFAIVRTQSGKTAATIKALEKISHDLNPSHPFAFEFLDKDMANLYKGEQQMGNIFNLFALLGIVISCLGLYGLSAFMSEQRTKEIGVRKVLGASVLNMVYLLSSGITRLILVSIVIAIPLAWFAVNEWLAGFSYHIEVGWVTFALAALTALGIAWITVSYESVKAAVMNPVKSLRSE